MRRTLVPQRDIGDTGLLHVSTNRGPVHYRPRPAQLFPTAVVAL